jgi:hypothetical protein
VFWNFLGALFTQGSVFVTNLVLARMLGKEAFGEFAMIQSTLLTLASVAQIATGFTVTKYVAEFRDVDKLRTGRVLGLCSMLTVGTGLMGTILLLIGAPWLADHALNASHLYPELLISASFVLFAVMNGYQIGALAGLEGYRMISVAGAILGGAHLAICWTATNLWALEGAVGGLTLSALLRWVIYSVALRRELASRGIIDRRPAHFYADVWNIFHHAPALIIGEKLERRNRMNSSVVLSDMTPGEKAFALWLEHLLNKVAAAEYRQLNIEALSVLASVFRQNPSLQIADDCVLDALIGHAVRLAYLEQHAEHEAGYNDYKADAWTAFLFSSSVSLPVPTSKTIGFTPFCWGGKRSSRRSLTSWLPVPGRDSTLLVCAPTAATAAPTPRATTSQMPMTTRA